MAQPPKFLDRIDEIAEWINTFIQDKLKNTKEGEEPTFGPDEVAEPLMEKFGLTRDEVEMLLEMMFAGGEEGEFDGFPWGEGEGGFPWDFGGEGEGAPAFNFGF